MRLLDLLLVKTVGAYWTDSRIFVSNKINQPKFSRIRNCHLTGKLRLICLERF